MAVAKITKPKVKKPKIEMCTYRCRKCGCEFDAPEYKDCVSVCPRCGKKTRFTNKRPV